MQLTLEPRADLGPHSPLLHSAPRCIDDKSPFWNRPDFQTPPVHSKYFVEARPIKLPTRRRTPILASDHRRFMKAFATLEEKFAVSNSTMNDASIVYFRYFVAVIY